MAEQAAGTVATAVINGVTERALTTVMRKLRSRSPAAHEKLQQLETLVLKLRCAVEVSEKHAIGSASLLEWRDRLREAAAEGGAVVLDFQRRAREAAADGEAAVASTSAPGQQQPAAGAMYFTWSALSGMARRARDATRRPLAFSADEDMEKLDATLEKMQRLSPDITPFLTALQVEVSLELARRPAKRRAPSPASASAPIPAPAEHILPKKMKFIRAVELPSPSRCPVERSARVTQCYSELGRPKVLVASDITRLASAGEAEDPEMEARRLADLLETMLQRVASYVKVMDDRDMGGFDWLAEWAAVLWEVVERGNAVLQTLRRPGSEVFHKAGDAALEEDGELYCFARAVQRLAWDKLCFVVLVDICPRKQ